MPTQHVMIRCPNCGTDWEPETIGALASAAFRCPVCEYRMREPSPVALPPLSSNELVERLGQLVREARKRGVASEVIVHALADELGFAAEMADGGRRMCVQVMDLGPESSDAAVEPNQDRTAASQRRGFPR